MNTSSEQQYTLRGATRCKSIYHPLFVAKEIDLDAFLLLDLDILMKYLPEVEFGARVKMASFIANHRKKQETQAVDAHQSEVAQACARVVEENNEKLLGRVAAMIKDAQLAAPPPRAAQHRALGGTDGGTAPPRSLNADDASMWLEDDARQKNCRHNLF